MTSNIKDEIFYELEQMAQYVFEPKTEISEIQKKFDNTINILTRTLDEIQKLYNIVKSDEIVITEDDLPNIVAGFNGVIDKVIQTYNGWLQMSNSIKDNVKNLYSLNMDMQEIRIEISTLLNNIVGGYSM